MIFNQVGGGNTSLADATITAKDIVTDKSGYNVDTDLIDGNAPFESITMDGFTSLPATDEWVGMITYDYYIALGKHGVIIAATDRYATEWDVAYLPNDLEYVTLHYSSKIIALARNTDKAFVINYSSSIISWEEIILPVVGDWSGIAFHNTYIKWLITSRDSNTVLYSDDAINWSVGTIDGITGITSLSVYGGVFGLASGDAPQVVSIKRSGDVFTTNFYDVPDGCKWDKVMSLSSSYIFLLSKGTDKVATANKTSFKWTVRTLPYVADWSNCIYFFGRYILFAPKSHKIAITQSWTSWDDIIYPDGYEWSVGSYYGDSYMVLLANNSKVYIYTTNYAEMSLQTQSGVSTYRILPETMKFTNEFGNSGEMVKQKNPDIIWNQEWFNISDYMFYCIAYGNNKFVAVGSSYASTSTDGVTWATPTSPPIYAQCMCYGNGKFVALSYNSTDAMYSFDGETWTKTTLPLSAGWVAVGYGNGIFVATANSGSKAIYSNDGITWIETDLPLSGGFYKICYGDGKFVIINSSDDNAISSTDGITWTVNSLPSYVRNAYMICYGDGKFVGINPSGTYATYSTDGINWTVVTVPNRYYIDVCYANGYFIAGEKQGNYLYSKDGITWSEGTLPLNVRFSAMGNSDEMVLLMYQSQFYVRTIPYDYTIKQIL